MKVSFKDCKLRQKTNQDSCFEIQFDVLVENRRNRKNIFIDLVQNITHQSLKPANYF